MPYAQLYCSAEHFERIRSDRRLWTALRLARTVNLLRALTTAVDAAGNHPARWQRRQRLNLLFCLGAALWEALLVADDIQPLSAFAAVRAKLVPFRRNKGLREFRKVLDVIRNQVAFHFDATLLPATLPDLKHPNYVFASHNFGNNLDRYYELADFALIPAAFAKGKFPSFVANYEQYLSKAMDYAKEYCAIMDAVLTEVAHELGFSNRMKDDADTSWA